LISCQEQFFESFGLAARPVCAKDAYKPTRSGMSRRNPKLSFSHPLCQRTSAGSTLPASGCQALISIFFDERYVIDITVESIPTIHAETDRLIASR